MRLSMKLFSLVVALRIAFKPATLAMPYKWVKVQDEQYSADSPNNRSLCEAGNVIDKE
jgi:hypothetical protein